jgi:hypothetical protein
MTKRIIAPLAAGPLCLYLIEASSALSYKYSDRVPNHLLLLTRISRPCKPLFRSGSHQRGHNRIRTTSTKRMA